MVRQNQGILQVGTLGTNNSLGTFSRVVVTNAPATATINGSAATMVAPYLLDGSGNFLTYSAGTGFVDAAVGTTTVSASTNTNDYVQNGRRRSRFDHQNNLRPKSRRHTDRHRQLNSHDLQRWFDVYQWQLRQFRFSQAM